MKEVVLDGVAFTKAAIAAKEFGYTTDYIGQLCRAKKVDARLVGRSWYVNTDSLRHHQQQRYANTKPSTPSTTSSTKQVSVKSDDIANKKYLRRVPPPNAKLKKIDTVPIDDNGGVRHVSVHYEADEKPLKIHTGSANVTKLEPEALPDVALSGKISVSEIPDGDYTNNPEEIARKKDSKEKSVSRDKSKNSLKIELVEELDSEKQARKEANKAVKASRQKTATGKQPSIEAEKAPATTVVSAQTTPKTDVQPQTGPSGQEIAVTNLNQTAPQAILIDYKLVTASLALSVLIGSMILSLEQVGNVTGSVTDFDLEIVWNKVANWALVLFTG
jgi:hypothetical protein